MFEIEIEHYQCVRAIGCFGTKECAWHAWNTPESIWSNSQPQWRQAHTQQNVLWRILHGNEREMWIGYDNGLLFRLNAYENVRDSTALYKLFVEFIWQIIRSCCLWIRKAERKARNKRKERINRTESGKYILNAREGKKCEKRENKRHLYYNVYAPAVDYLWKMVIVSKHETWFHVLRTMYKLNIFPSYRLQEKRLFHQITKRLRYNSS